MRPLESRMVGQAQSVFLDIGARAKGHVLALPSPRGALGEQGPCGESALHGDDPRCDVCDVCPHPLPRVPGPGHRSSSTGSFPRGGQKLGPRQPCARRELPRDPFPHEIAVWQKPLQLKESEHG